MKKIFIITLLLTVFSAGYTYAQYGDYYDGKNSYYYSDMKKGKKSSQKAGGQLKKNEITIAPSLYAPAGRHTFIEDYTTIGGGVDLSYKYNFFPVFGVSGKFRYNYSEGTHNLDDAGTIVNRKIEAEHHLIDIQLLAVLQYEFTGAKGSFIPYFGTGFTVTTLVLNSKESYTQLSQSTGKPLNDTVLSKQQVDANIGFVASSGMKYVFQNNVIIGAGLDYTLVWPVHNYSGYRFFVEAGYRF